MREENQEVNSKDNSSIYQAYVTCSRRHCLSRAYCLNPSLRKSGMGAYLLALNLMYLMLHDFRAQSRRVKHSAAEISVTVQREPTDHVA